MDDYAQVKQGTPEWLQARCGFVTASVVWKVLAKGAQGKPSDVREKYKWEKTMERVTGKPIGGNGFVSRAMQEGIEREPEARLRYQIEMQQLVTEYGFARHPTIAWCGCSPDGLVAADGLVQIKCPEHPQHGRTVEDDEIDTKYKHQMDLELACFPDRQFVDFVSFHPDFPVWAQLKVIRYDRDPAKIAKLEAQIRVFLAEVDKKLLWWQGKELSLMEALQQSAQMS